MLYAYQLSSICSIGILSISQDIFTFLQNIDLSKKDNTRDCWTVAFGNSFNAEERVVAAGFDNGDVKLFDLRNMKLQWSTNVSNGVCGLQFDRMGEF